MEELTGKSFYQLGNNNDNRIGSTEMSRVTVCMLV